MLGDQPDDLSLVSSAESIMGFVSLTANSLEIADLFVSVVEGGVVAAELLIYCIVVDLHCGIIN